MIVADRVLLVGGPYDGVIADFAEARYLCMHDPHGSRPPALYLYNLVVDLRNGDVHVNSADFVKIGETL